MVQFTIDRRLDPDGAQLRQILEAQFTYERMSAARSLFAHLLAIVGVVIWVEAIWPDILPPEVRLFTLVLWGSILFVAVWAAIAEYAWGRRLESHLGRKRELR